MSSVCPTKAQVLQLFQSHERDLVTALSSTDLRKLTNDLLINVIISKEIKDTFASLDLDRLDPQLVARYMLSIVFQRIESGDVGYRNLVRALSGAGGCVRKLVGIIREKLTEDCNTADPNVSMTLRSDNVSVLTTCLVECSHKWEELAIALKLPVHVKAECGNAGSNIAKLSRVLTNWLKTYPQTKKPTMTSLKTALAGVIVGEGRLASNLQESYMKAMTDEPGHLPETAIQDSTQFQLVHQPSDTKVADHRSALLGVQVSPSESVSYQWMKDGQPLSDNSDLFGTRTEILLINHASIGAEGEYCCQINYGNEHFTSISASLTLAYSPDKQILISLCKRFQEVPVDSWPLAGTKQFIDIVLVQIHRSLQSDVFIEQDLESILGNRNVIDYRDAFSHYADSALILLEGHPGSGKTTLAHKLVKDWAKGNLLKNTDRVFLISLRKDVQKSELFQMFFHGKAEEFMKNIEACQGDKTCFILDGYDEFSPSDKNTSILHQLIHKTYLPLAMIIITSRPTATIELRQLATTRIETLGFTKENFDLFLNNYPFDISNDIKNLDTTNSKIKKQLKAYSNVLNMCYLPVNASIFCFLFSQGLSDGQLPKTETQIYEKLVIAIILRKLRQNNPKKQIKSIKNLKSRNRKCFSLICSLAFDMTIENKQIVHQLPLPLEHLNETPFRGLLAIDCIAKVYGLEDVVTFLHLTLQKYLAAYHLANLPDDQQAEVIKLHGDKSHLLTMFKFYCGQTHSKERVLQLFDISSIKQNLLFIAHCAYEKQDPQVCPVSLQVLNLSNVILTPADCTALGYVISQAPEYLHALAITSCQLYEDSMGKTNNDDPFVYHGIDSICSGIEENFIAMRNLMVNNISYKMADQHLKNFHQIMKREELLAHYRGNIDDAKLCLWDVHANNCIRLNPSCAEPLINAISKCSNVKYLHISDNISGEGSTEIIDIILRRNMRLTNITIRHGLKSTTISTFAVVLEYYIHLQELNIESNSFNSEEAAALLLNLKYCNFLQNLSLLNCEIGPANANALAKGINNLPLEKVFLCGNKFGPEGALALAREGCFKTVSDLNLSHNDIGSQGAKAISNVLRRGNFHSVTLAGNKIESDGMPKLVEGLSHCKKLQHINLTSNPIGVNGVTTLASCLANWTNLSQLSLWRCNITSDGIPSLVRGLRSWSSILLLDLSENSLCSKRMFALASLLINIPFLQYFYLSHNQIDCKGAKHLASGLKHCHFLSVLNISHNNIGSTGATAIAKGLICKDIEFVNFSTNSIGPRNDILVDSLAALAKRGHVEVLDLTHNSMGKDSIVSLVTNLIFCKHQMKLNISDNNTPPKVSQFIIDLKKFPLKITVYHKN